MKEASAAVVTFEQAARAWHTHRLAALDKGHAERLMARLERDAFPELGGIDLNAVTAADVLTMVRRVEARGALNVSRRLKPHVSQISRCAISLGWAERDPAEHLGDLLKAKPRCGICRASGWTNCRRWSARLTAMMATRRRGGGR